MQHADNHGRLAELLCEHSIRRGHFVLKSGRVSDYYLDCRRTTLHAEGARLVGEEMLAAVERLGWTRAAAVGGMSLGADPIATATSIASLRNAEPMHAFLVRKAVKEHGTQQRIERCPDAGTPVVVVEDTVTTGGSALEAVEACRLAELDVVGVLGLVDREEGGAEAFAERGVPFAALYTASELLERTT
jgi:orotate phosphoribosyltransferase